MYKFLTLIIFSSVTLYAQTLYSFSNVSINYLDWSSSTKSKTSKEDFAYVTLEGGVGWDWGEFYGNVNLENPTKKYSDESPNELRYTAFGDFDINIKNGFKIHFQDFHLHSDTFYVNDFVVGASYKYESNFGLWIKPFIGVHYTNDTYFNGLNGYMGGWVFNYDFEMFNQKFSISQWNEIEFARDKEFYENDGEPIGDSKSYGLNGALSTWWHINDDITSGVQYRYANHKLGNIEYQSAFIYTFKYNF